MGKRWQLMPYAREKAECLARDLDVPRLVAQLLLNRGITEAGTARRFLRPELGHLHSPSLLPDLERGLQRLVTALRQGEPILVFGDYDADGLTAVSLLMRLLKPISNGPVYYYVPKRLEEGYGLSVEVIKRAAARGVRLIVTVDCGISAIEEIGAARDLGIDVIVTDHHEPGGHPPEAVAVIDPKLPGSRYPFRDLAGVGVAFKLGQALVEAGILPQEKLLEHLDLVALGTVADVVPLRDENRVLACHGLARLNHTGNPGLRAMLEAARLDGREVTAGHVGFVLAPRLNASGRIGDPSLGVKLLLTSAIERGREIAGLLEKENSERQRIEARVLEEATAIIQSRVDLEHERALVLSSTGWHRGVIGIVASRLVEAFHRPVILISIDGGEGRGSGRSIPGFHLYQGLSRCRSLERFGGHEAAAGLTVAADRVAEFAREFGAIAREEIDDGMLESILKIEAEVGLEEIDLTLARAIANLAPFGLGNPAPILACRGARILHCRGVGENGKHLKLRVAQGREVRDGIGFNLGSFSSVIEPEDQADLAFTIEENHFNGSTEVQLNLRDLARNRRIAAAGEAGGNA